jgi:shikimate kinase
MAGFEFKITSPKWARQPYDGKIIHSAILHQTYYTIQMKKCNLALIGARGAGKSKLSRKLSKALGRPSFSTDEIITYEAGGVTIENLVAKRGGWPAFRDREFVVLENICRMKKVIVDCGGGILVEAPISGKDFETFSERKKRCLEESCLTVYLRRPEEVLLAKMNPDCNRPDLGKDYQELLQRRLPWYESCADLIIDLKDLNAKHALDQIMEALPDSIKAIE